MITDLNADELVALGERHRVASLLQQAGYTLGIAAEDGPELADLLDEGYLDEVSAAVDELRGKIGDRSLMEAEALRATRAQNEELRRAKVWRRKVVRRGQRYARLGKTVPAVLLQVSKANSVQELDQQLVKMRTALSESQATLGGDRLQPLIDEWQTIHAALTGADATQEQKRLAELPAAVREFYLAKGRLYIGLKVINDAGHELHAENAAAGGRYNLRLLYRRGSK